MDDKKFAVALNLIQQLAAAWADESRQAAVRAHLMEVMSRMTNEQLEAFTEYQSKMTSDKERELESLRQHLGEAESELDRRAPRNH